MTIGGLPMRGAATTAVLCLVIGFLVIFLPGWAGMPPIVRAAAVVVALAVITVAHVITRIDNERAAPWVEEREVTA